MIEEKHIVFNCLIGQYEYLASKDDVASRILKNALELYYSQTRGVHYRCVYIDEHGYEYESKDGGDNGTEIPPELLAEALNKINENL
jgi:hypothetical protein